jgi:hypothetical protein
VTAIGPGQAPADWGCDAVWQGGEAVLEKCIAVFGIIYKLDEKAVEPPYFQKLFSAFPQEAGTHHCAVASQSCSVQQ